jgi:hypothetical protein
LHQKRRALSAWRCLALWAIFQSFPVAAADNPPEIPSEIADSQAAANPLDTLKERYEALYVNYLLLRRCQLTDTSAYHLLNSGLMQELASVNAPSRLQYDIITAARGTYNEIYSRLPCDQLGDLRTRFQQYVQSIGARDLSPQ